MGLDLLDTPVRLTWDLHGSAEPLGAAQLLEVAGRVAAGGVFFVTLEERPLAHPVIRELLDQLAVGGCQVQVVCAGSADELAALEQLAAPVPAVQLDVAAFLAQGTLDEARLCDTLARLRQSGVEPTLRLTPLQSNLHVIPRLLALCQECFVRRFKLPNARIGDTFQSISPAELPRWPDLAAFRVAWTRQALELPGSLQLEIHDRFLWEIMSPDCEQARGEYGGCQAANSLGHVDAGGTVYACAAWPEALGSLLSESLDAIWQSPRRLTVRERIGRVPAGCVGCRDYPLCLGGCRGLGEILNPAAGCRDLMCRAPRD
jgi:GeoRSP system SPASM domain protein